MSRARHHRLQKGALTRRDMLWLAATSPLAVQGGGMLLAGFTLTGCAVNPVTGEKQLMLMSESQEIAVDKSHAPHQFSSDYGVVQESQVNRYLNGIGKQLAQRSHRPKMPYSFQAVNANHVNAYAFPGGTIATTRGIIVAMENEAELGGLLGHEIGHVNARHAAQRMSKGMLTQALLAGGSAALRSSSYASHANLFDTLGGVGAGALLAHYSRENEREADALGMTYMTRAGLNPKGMTGLMELLTQQSRKQPGALDLMFSTHPPSRERLANANKALQGNFRAAAKEYPLNRDRYKDNTASLRRIRSAIQALQRGEKLMAKKRFPQAEGEIQKALTIAPGDYAALTLMAKNQLAQNKLTNARHFAENARKAYPQEGQAHNLLGITHLKGKNYSQAYAAFDQFDRRLPGNPATTFLKGFSLEGMNDLRGAAKHYVKYLKVSGATPQGKYAHGRLLKWGVIKPAKKKKN